MEDWLMSKKLEEAERVAHLRQIDEKDEILSGMRERYTNSFKGWLSSEKKKKRLSKKQANSKNAQRFDEHAREQAQREMEQAIFHKQAQMAGAYDMDDMDGEMDD